MWLLTIDLGIGFRDCGWSPVTGPGSSRSRISTTSLPSYFDHAFLGTQCTRTSLRFYQLPGEIFFFHLLNLITFRACFLINYFLIIVGFDSILSYSAHFTSRQSSRLLIRLAGNCLSPRLHRSTSFDYASAEGLGDVCPTFNRLVQVFGSFLAER